MYLCSNSQVGSPFGNTIFFVIGFPDGNFLFLYIKVLSDHLYKEFKWRDPFEPMISQLKVF